MTSSGAVSINLANYVAFQTAQNRANKDCTTPETQAGAGGRLPAGPQMDRGTHALVRMVKYYPLVADTLDGSHTTDFVFKGSDVWGFDLADGTWNEANFPEKLTHFFYILFWQDFTQAGGATQGPPSGTPTPRRR